MVVYNGFDFYVLSPTRASGRLPEYPYTGPEPTPYTKSVYVEVPDADDYEPQPFLVEVNPIDIQAPTGIEQATYDYMFDLTVDGFTSATCAIYPTDELGALGIRFDSIQIASADGKTYVKKPTFFEPVQLTLDDDDNSDTDGPVNLAKIGTVEVCFVELDPEGTRPWQKDLDEIWNLGPRPGTYGVSKAMVVGMEALSHVTSVGEEDLGEEGEVVEVYEEKEGAPLYVVRFIYRSRAALTRMGVVVKNEETKETKEAEEIETSAGCGFGWLFKRMFKRKESKKDEKDKKNRKGKKDKKDTKDKRNKKETYVLEKVQTFVTE
ncbi:hypothetical protein BJ508DRAFT_325582 [Ascobolus immersus RN42]|uniref:DUF7918 domain-containing protein n=1 Tax=Ascobolus immersus RN42 TaxID=1160509 RepID=A0A3N4I8A1_ASCIM|nr:hypothetical protein BJ508DRAFT_325582 [Ascobolus immersus RN42]